MQQLTGTTAAYSLHEHNVQLGKEGAKLFHCIALLDFERKAVGLEQCHVCAEECLHARIEAQGVVAGGARGVGTLFERLQGVGPQRIKCRLAFAPYRIAQGRSGIGRRVR